MSNVKELAFKISVQAKDAQGNVEEMTTNIILLEKHIKKLQEATESTDFGADAFQELVQELLQAATAESIYTKATDKAIESSEKLGETLQETAKDAEKTEESIKETGNQVETAEEKFKKLELRIRETRVALQKAEEAGDKVTFKKLKGDLDELEDALEATKLKSKQLDDVLVEIPGPIGLVGQAMKGLDAAFKLFIANPIVALLTAFVGGLLLLKKSLSSTAEGQALLNRMSAAFGKILGPIMATLEAIAIPTFEFFALVLEKVAKGFSFVAKAAGISSDKIKEATLNSSEVLKKADEDRKKAIEDRKKMEDDAAQKEKDRLKKLSDDRKKAHQDELARIAEIKKQKQEEININENLQQSELELARSTVKAGDDIIANLQLKDAQREEDFLREKKRIEDLLKLEKDGSAEKINLQIQLNNLIAANNKSKFDIEKEISDEQLKIAKEIADEKEKLAEKDADANELAADKYNETLEKQKSLAQTKIDLAIRANDEEFAANDMNFEKQRELLDAKKVLLQKDYDEKRQLTYDDDEKQLLLEADFNSKMKELSDTRVAVGKKEVEFKEAQFDQLANILSSAAALAGEETSAGKFLASASASISTGLAIAKALSSSAPPMNFLSAALVGAAGLKNIARIDAIQVPKPNLKRYASGGLVIGEGTGTSDSIPAYLSNGESVINARSTAIFKPILSAMNAVGGGKRFASGGIVGENTLSSQELINTQLMAFNNQSNQPIKTYVVASDMSSAQQFDRVQRERSTI